MHLIDKKAEYLHTLYIAESRGVGGGPTVLWGDCDFNLIGKMLSTDHYLNLLRERVCDSVELALLYHFLNLVCVSVW